MPRILLPNYLESFKTVSASLDSSQCARLVQAIENEESGCITQVSKYGGSQKVRSCSDIVAGTVIATLIDGSYPNESRGNHVAIFVSKDKDGITVFDQYTGKAPGERKIRYKGAKHARKEVKDESGLTTNVLQMSNDGDFYYVVETTA